MMKRYLIGAALAAVAIAQTGDKRIERPPKFKLDGTGWGLLLSSATVTALDHYTTVEIIAGGGYEKNQRFATATGINHKKLGAADIGNIGAVAFYEGWAKHRVPGWLSRWVVEPIIAGGISYRGKRVIDNFGVLGKIERYNARQANPRIGGAR